jgi:coenzyme Q-binding protein COQ10
LRHSLTRVLPYTPAQLFALVGDVERYPEFIRWVSALRAWNRRADGRGATLLDAEAQVKFSIVRERFATRVRLDDAAKAIDVDLLSGPFRKLESRWRFHPHARGCELSFDIDFEFGSRFLEGLLAVNFERAVGKIIGAFESRARFLYGPAARPRPSSGEADR